MKKAVASLFVALSIMGAGITSAENPITNMQTQNQIEQLSNSSYVDWSSKQPIKDLKLTDEKGKFISTKETFSVDIAHRITNKDAKVIAGQIKDKRIEKATLMVIKTVVIVTNKNELIATPVATVFYVPDNKNKTMTPIDKVYQIDKPQVNANLSAELEKAYKNKK